jgi:hypothetical protein
MDLPGAPCESLADLHMRCTAQCIGHAPLQSTCTAWHACTVCTRTVSAAAAAAAAAAGAWDTHDYALREQPPGIHIPSAVM